MADNGETAGGRAETTGEQGRWRVVLFTVQQGKELWRVARDDQTIEEPGRYSAPAWIIHSRGDAEALAFTLNDLEARLATETAAREQAVRELHRLERIHQQTPSMRYEDLKAAEEENRKLRALVGRLTARVRCIEANPYDDTDANVLADAAALEVQDG